MSYRFSYNPKSPAITGAPSVLLGTSEKCHHSRSSRENPARIMAAGAGAGSQGLRTNEGDSGKVGRVAAFIAS